MVYVKKLLSISCMLYIVDTVKRPCPFSVELYTFLWIGSLFYLSLLGPDAWTLLKYSWHLTSSKWPTEFREQIISNYYLKWGKTSFSEVRSQRMSTHQCIIVFLCNWKRPLSCATWRILVFSIRMLPCLYEGKADVVYLQVTL